VLYWLPDGAPVPESGLSLYRKRTGWNRLRVFINMIIRLVQKGHRFWDIVGNTAPPLVIKDIPGNTHFHFDLFFSMKSLDYPWGQIGNVNFHTYLALKPGADPKVFEQEFQDFIKRYELPALKDFQIYSMADLEKSGNRIHFSLIPVTRIHLYSDRQGGEELSPPGLPGGRGRYLPTLGIKLLKGRNFSAQFRTDSSAVIINETAAGILGYADPIGKNI
jgi:hypothetical protein